MELKVCGLKDPENIKQVAKLKPTYIGFIFYNQSKRFVGENFVMPEISDRIKKTGVFVNASPEYILNKVNKYRLNIIQLHGDESPEFCNQFKNKIELIKAFAIDKNFDFSILNKYKSCCDYFLFDTKTNDFGGSGKAFDWKILNNYKMNVPFFLSGGIGLKEIAKISSFKFQIHAIDVNSKFEIEPGIKDIDKLRIATSLAPLCLSQNKIT